MTSDRAHVAGKETQRTPKCLKTIFRQVTYETSKKISVKGLLRHREVRKEQIIYSPALGLDYNGSLLQARTRVLAYRFALDRA